MNAPPSYVLRRLLATVGPLPPPAPAPALVVAAGLPGSGKSTLSRALASALPAAVVSSDALRRALFATPTYTPQESGAVFVRAYALTDWLLRQAMNVVFDATSLVERDRKRLYRIAARAGARLLLIWVTAPEEVVRRRLEERLRQPDADSEADWGVYEKMAPTAEPIRRPHLVADTTQELGKLVRMVQEALQGMAEGDADGKVTHESGSAAPPTTQR